jgi:hypothetical protein
MLDAAELVSSQSNVGQCGIVEVAGIWRVRFRSRTAIAP